MNMETNNIKGLVQAKAFGFSLIRIQRNLAGKPAVGVMFGGNPVNAIWQIDNFGPEPMMSLLRSLRIFCFVFYKYDTPTVLEMDAMVLTWRLNGFYFGG